MIKQKNSKKMTASVEQSNTTAVAENQKAVSSHITMPAKKHQALPVTVESSNLNTNHKDTGNKTSMTKPPLPQTVRKPANSKPNGMNPKGFGVIDQNAITTFCDGVQVLPVKIRSYDWMAITSDEYQLCKKVGRESYSLDAKGVPVPCIVIKTKTAFAVVGQNGNAGFCKWAMSSFDIVKKVKGTDGIAYVDIQIHDEMGCQKYRVPRSVFAEGKINSLTKFNIAVNNAPESVSAMAIYFTRLLDEIPMEDASQVLGVVKNSVTQECVFNGYREDGVFKVANQYGSYEGYLEHFNPLLEKSEALQYLLSATMAAPVMTVLQQKYNKDVHSYIINAVGLSSTGKTITSRFCAAAWTNPKDSVIFSAMHSTANASLKKLAGRYGVPTFLDEATASGIKAEEYAYSVYEGVEKERLNSDCSMRASGTWSTIICISSEEHFHMNRKNQNGGLAVRVHSMDEGGCPAIVPKKLLEKVQERLAENSSKASRAKPKRYYPLNGMIYCAKCGARMTGNVSHSGKHLYYQYRCTAKCGNKSVRADQLEESILNVLRDSLFSTVNQSAILKAMNQRTGAQKHSTDRRYQQLRAKLSGLEKSEENLLAVIEKGQARTSITNRLERISKEKEQIQTEINQLDRSKYTFKESDLTELSNQFTAYMQLQGDINTKRLIKSLIDRVDVSEDNVKITLADGISVDKTVKNTMYKEKKTMMNQVPTVKTVTMDAVLMNAEMKNHDLVKCKFALRRNGELGFTDSCELSLPESAFFNFAKYSECEYFDLFGSKFTLDAQLNDQGQIAKVISLKKAA